MTFKGDQQHQDTNTRRCMLKKKFLSTLSFNKHTIITICVMEETADIKSKRQTAYLMKRQFHP